VTPASLVEIVVPVHDEAHVVAASVRMLHRHLTERFPYRWRITVVENGSSDGTWEAACRLADELANVRVGHLEHAGRGGAIRAAWSASDAPVVAYLDVDLSTDLDALVPLVAPLLAGRGDVAVGSRLSPGSRVRRSLRREVLSRSYNLLLRAVLGVRFRDAQCGFKAARAEVARRLLPLVEDDGWFFDTELLVTAERAGLRILEVPVDWVEDPDSRVRIWRTIGEDLAGVWRLARRRAPAPVAAAPAARATV
jgi:glycosyltransferase involved in cell wall biosynthesis